MERLRYLQFLVRGQEHSSGTERLRQRFLVFGFHLAAGRFSGRDIFRGI